MISVQEHHRLVQAIRDAEAMTAGEIIVVVARSASRYRLIPALWALTAALLAPWPLIAFTRLGPTRIFLIQLAIAAGLSLVFAWPRIHTALVPGFVKKARAREAAMREFIGRGLTRTRRRTGILIYVAALEHHAEIIADIGIADRAGPQVWQKIIADLTAAIGEGRPGDGLVHAVERAGAILAEHVPPSFDDEDELPNKVIFL
jgi:putative membrane protein